MVKLLTDSRLPEEEHEFFHILNLFFPSIYDVKYLMKSCKNLKVQYFLSTSNNNNKKPKRQTTILLSYLSSICCAPAGASMVLDRLCIELTGTGICVVTGFNLGMKGAPLLLSS